MDANSDLHSCTVMHPNKKTYMYTTENVTVMMIIGATRKLIKIRTDHNSDPHEYHLGLHEDKITLKNKGK